MTDTYRNVCEVIVPNDLCAGCGICAGICPAHVLEMQFNDYGEYRPVEAKEGCLSRCDLCLRSCPFWNQVDNEDSLAEQLFSGEKGIKHTSETGYYLQSYAGFSNVDGHRANGASGGMTTWLLETLLRENLVDAVICVTHNPDPQKLYKFSVLKTVEEIRGASRSAYYPVEQSEVIQYILNHEGRYAITGLPCFIKSLRLAMRQNRRLRDRLLFLVGLVCGQTQSKFLSEYLCLNKGGDPEKLAKVTYRVKDLQRHANDFGYEFVCSGGKVTSARSFWKQDIGKAWSQKYFTPRACFYCDDTFAETADVVFLDAWLDEYISNPKGTNIAIIRNRKLLDLIDNAANNGDISIKGIAIDKVIQTQEGVIQNKQTLLADRLGFLAKSQKSYIPSKRIVPHEIDRVVFITLFLEEIYNKSSKYLFHRLKNNVGLKIFNAYVFIFQKLIGSTYRLQRNAGKEK